MISFGLQIKIYRNKLPQRRYSVKLVNYLVINEVIKNILVRFLHLCTYTVI